MATKAKPSATAFAGVTSFHLRLALWVKRSGAAAIRWPWMLLPEKWKPWAYTWACKATAILPATVESRATGFFGRMWAQTASIELHYATWIKFYERAGAKAHLPAGRTSADGPDMPLISILMPFSNPSANHLDAAIRSVLDQVYPGWELCVAGSSADPAIAALLRHFQAQDPRIRLAPDSDNRGADAAFSMATGSFVTLLQPDATLSPMALHDVAGEIASCPGADIIYSDEDLIDETGRRSMPYFKPDWNPELMLGQNLIGHLSVYRRALMERAGGFRHDPDEGEWDYSVALRAVAATSPDRIRHVPKVLYHAREAGGDRGLLDVAKANNRHAASAFLRHVAPECAVSVPVWGRVAYPVPSPEPLVSVIVPTRDHADMLARTMAGLLGRTDYPSLEVLLVDNGSEDPEAVSLLKQLAQGKRVRVLRRPGPFNYSALNNDAVREATGDLVLLLNNDIDVIHPDWLREMVSHAIRPGVGAVGAKLLYPDGSVQHGGIAVGMFGVANHQFLHDPGDGPGYAGHLALARNVTAVTGACLLVRRDRYLEVGGLNEASLPVAFNDVDLCLKLVERGYRNVWTPHARLYHLESASRGADTMGRKAVRFKREVAYMRERWGATLDNDPYWSANFSLDSTSPMLSFPPRRRLC